MFRKQKGWSLTDYTLQSCAVAWCFSLQLQYSTSKQSGSHKCATAQKVRYTGWHTWKAHTSCWLHVDTTTTEKTKIAHFIGLLLMISTAFCNLLSETESVEITPSFSKQICKMNEGWLTNVEPLKNCEQCQEKIRNVNDIASLQRCLQQCSIVTHL